MLGAIKSHYKTETVRNSWRKMKVVNGKLKRSKVTKIWVESTTTGPQGETIVAQRECSTKCDMEQAVMEENEERFTRCTWTSFFKGLLLSIIGFMFDGPAFWEVLQGTWQPPQNHDMDPHAVDLMEHVRDNRIDSSHCSRPSHISKEEHSYHWQRRQAGTASESSELTFPHYIAGSHDPRVAEIDAASRSAPYELGFAPTAWLHMTDFQILKKAGVYLVSKMRTIKLFHPAFNENNKKLGRDNAFHAEQAGVFAAEQCGSRKHHSSNQLAAEVELSFDILRQQRLSAVHIGLDASQCYDRMAHAPTALCMVQHGAHEPAVRSMFGVLQKAKNKVATAFGVSTSYYGGHKREALNKTPIQGVGQGNGAGPISFVDMSSTGISLMAIRGFGAVLQACLSLLVLSNYRF